jgi:tetratricopeptide (TPR) repeat protein
MNGRRSLLPACRIWATGVVLTGLALSAEQAQAQAQTGPADSQSSSKPAAPKKNQSLAVLTFKNLRPSADTDWIGAGAGETLTTRLAGVPGLVLVERSEVKKVLEEQDIQSADLTDPKSAVKAGKVLGVGRIVVGTYFNDGGKVTFNVRVLDVETAEVLNAANINGKDDDIGALLLQLAEAVIKSFDKKVVIEDSKPVVRDSQADERIDLTPEQRQSFQNIGTSNAKAYEAYSRAKAAFTAGDAAGVIAWLTKAVELDPKFALALNDRAVTYMLSKRLDLALPDINAAIQLEPKNAMFWMNRGYAYAVAGQVDNAMKDFDKAIEVNPAYPNTYGMRGLINAQRGQLDAAIKDFTKGISIYPFHTLYYARANCYYTRQRYDLAVQDMNAAISQVPSYAGYYLGRSQAYYGMGQYARAVADARLCVQHGGQIPPQYMMMLNAVANQ